MKPDNDKKLTPDAGAKRVVREEAKKPWKPMELTYAGDAKDLVQGGTGKKGITLNDPGDTAKPQGQG